MTATIASNAPAGIGSSRFAVYFTAAVLIVAAVAAAVWLFLPTSSQSVPAQGPRVDTGQYNQVCAPAPGTRYC